MGLIVSFMRCADLTQNVWTFQLYLKSLGKECWYGKMLNMSAHPLFSSKSALTWSMMWPQSSPYHQPSALSCLQTRPWLLIMPWFAGADILGKTNKICREPPSRFGSDSALKVNSWYTQSIYLSKKTEDNSSSACNRKSVFWCTWGYGRRYFIFNNKEQTKLFPCCFNQIVIFPDEVPRCVLEYWSFLMNFHD